jgi:hypothetical protein
VPIIEFLKEFYTLFFVWLTCLTAILIFGKRVPIPFGWFALLIIVVSILETIASAISFFRGIKNHFLFNIIYGLELTFVPFFFKYWLHSAWVKKFIRIFVFVFPLFVVVNTIWIQGFFTLQTYGFVAGGSVLLLLSVAYLIELYTDEEALNILRNPVFWISIAYLMYFAVSVPYVGMLNYLVKNQLEFATKYYLIIMDGTICLYNILLTTAFLCMRARPK